MLLSERIDTRNFYVIKQIFAGFTVGLSLMSVGCWLGWPASFLHDITIEEIAVDLTLSQKSWVIILMDIGNSCSPIPTGYMMDLIGRKPTLLITSLIFILSWIFTLISLNPYCLYTARFLAGFGKGMSYTVVPMYLAEISETKYRGGISTLLTQLTYFGICFEVVVSEPTSYVLLNSLSLIVPISCLLLIILIPESPYYLIMKNKQEKAFKAFCWLRKIEAKNFENKYSNENIKTEMENMDKQVKYELESRGRWWDLVSSRGTRLATGIVLTTTAMQRLGGMSSALSYTTITLPENERGLTPLQYMMFFAIACMLGSLTCMMLVDKIGRRPLLITSTALCALVQIITAFFYYYHNHPTIDATNFKWTPYICLLVFAFVYVLGIGTIPHTLVGEMFPANVKSKAAALATTILSTSLIVDKIFLHISEEHGVQWMFMIFAITNTIAAIFSYVFVLETKGKSTSEIQQMLQVLNKEQIQEFQLNSI